MRREVPMEFYPVRALERAMKVQEEILRASGEPLQGMRSVFRHGITGFAWSTDRVRRLHLSVFSRIHPASQASFSVEMACSQSSTNFATKTGSSRLGFASHSSRTPMRRSAVPK